MSRLCDDSGRFAMLAIDQRGSLQDMIAKRVGAHADSVSDDALAFVKRIITKTVSPLATAVLTDPLIGYPASVDVIPPGVGILLAGEITGYEATGEADRLSRLIEGWTVENTLRCGADAFKLLLWHHPEASQPTHAHQQELVEQCGRACAEAGLPFVLEIVTYSIYGSDTRDADYARIKPDIVIDAAEVYSAPRYGVDLLKMEFPANLKYVEEYQVSSFGKGQAVYDRAFVEDACARLDAAAAVPWVILSAGVGPDEFVENVSLCNAAGASGFLCGRVVWKEVIDFFPDAVAMRNHAQRMSRSYFERIRAANSGAKPWHQHRRFEALRPAYEETA